MIRVLVSSCLLGEAVRYHGGHARVNDSVLLRWQREGRLVPFCPEVGGGFSVPREPAEIQRGDGGGVLDGAVRVVDKSGRDVTDGFVAGADAAVRAAVDRGVRLAILKDGSPSCGSQRIYDGTFSGQTRTGQGVATAALERAGIRVFGALDLQAAHRFLEALEAQGGN